MLLLVAIHTSWKKSNSFLSGRRSNRCNWGSLPPSCVSWSDVRAIAIIPEWHKKYHDGFSSRNVSPSVLKASGSLDVRPSSVRLLGRSSSSAYDWPSSDEVLP